MRGTIELRTERLILRRHVPEDAYVLYSCFGTDEEMYKYSGWNPYASVEMAKATVRDFINSYSDPHFYGWAIVLNCTLIGTAGAYDYNAENESIEVGISIRRVDWGKGYAGEVIPCILKYLTESEGVRIVRAWCASDNIGSRKIMERAGMDLVSTEAEALQIGENSYDKLNFEYCI